MFLKFTSPRKEKIWDVGFENSIAKTYQKSKQSGKYKFFNLECQNPFGKWQSIIGFTKMFFIQSLEI
jgi:hypothetical protein